MYSKRIQITKKVVSALLLLGIGWHTLSVHGFSESVVYCFEADGDINIESKSDFIFGFENEHKVHDDAHHKHEGAEYHASPESHRDVELSETCTKDNRISRFDQDSALDFLAFNNNRSGSYLPNSALDQLHTFIPSNATYQSAFSLKTVVLLN